MLITNWRKFQSLIPALFVFVWKSVRRPLTVVQLNVLRMTMRLQTGRKLTPIMLISAESTSCFSHFLQQTCNCDWLFYCPAAIDHFAVSYEPLLSLLLCFYKLLSCCIEFVSSKTKKNKKNKKIHILILHH